MCGIAGIHRRRGDDADPALLRRMTDVMVHRGPDDEGYYEAPGIGLGMRRLSIIDITSGHQPITNETGTLWIVFNGEIYNYKELRDELVARGHRLATRSDTEVIVHLYEDLGPACLTRLNGMFAFAIWDAERRELFVARDRLGVKPLYYHADDDGLVFASELKALLRCASVPRTLDRQALADYLTFMYVPAPKTPFRSVAKLEPGHYLVANRDGVRVARYWSLDDYVTPRDVSLDEAAARIRELLDDAIRLRLRSDVPVGAFLSGGVDSSTVVALAARQLDKALATFSVGFTLDGIDELPWAKRVASDYGTAHHEIQVTPEDVIRLLPKLVWHMDEPSGDSALIPTYMVSELARERVAVILSGLGGDEVFAGYPRYRLPFERGSRAGRVWRQLPKAVREVFLPVGARMSPRLHARLMAAGPRADHDRYLDAVSVFSHEEKLKLFARNGWAHPGEVAAHYRRYPGRDPVNRLLYVDAHTYLPDDILALTDRMSMAVSLEAREPLLDHRLVEYCAGLPGALKLEGAQWKIALKRAMEPLLPREIVTREKQGFGGPVSSWLLRRLLPYASAALRHGWLVEQRVLDARGVQDLIANVGRDALAGQQLWTLFMLELWARVHTGEPSLSAPTATLPELVAS